MTAGLGEADLARMARAGIEAISDQQGLELFDAAWRSDRALLLAFGFDVAPCAGSPRAAWCRRCCRTWSGFPAAPPAPATSAARSAQHLAAIAPAQRRPALAEAIGAQVVTVLGHASPEAVGLEQSFLDAGFDRSPDRAAQLAHLRQRPGAAGLGRLRPPDAGGARRPRRAEDRGAAGAAGGRLQRGSGRGSRGVWPGRIQGQLAVPPGPAPGQDGRGDGDAERRLAPARDLRARRRRGPGAVADPARRGRRRPAPDLRAVDAGDGRAASVRALRQALRRRPRGRGAAPARVPGGGAAAGQRRGRDRGPGRRRRKPAAGRPFVLLGHSTGGLLPRAWRRACRARARR